MLWGMMMAPTMPTACSSSGRPQPEHEGRSRSWRSASWAGRATTYCGEEPHQAMRKAAIPAIYPDPGR